MLIKLNYNGSKTFAQAFRAIAEIINQPTITSISALRSNSGSWATDVLQSLDDATSYIYRTTNSTGVVCHIARPNVTTSSNWPFDFVLEFPTYDASSSKQYYKLSSTSVSGTYAVTEQYSNTLNSGTLMTSSQWAITGTTTTTGAVGTPVSLAGTPTAPRSVYANSLGLTTLWVYITPSSLVWTAVLNNGTFQPSGWFGTNSYYSNNTNLASSVYSQYKRYDYWNTSANGILPFVYLNPNIGNQAFLQSTSELGITNTNSSTSTECTFYAYNYINATPSTNTSFPVTYATRVALGIGTRYSDTTALTTSNSSTTNATDTCYGAVLNTSAVQTRIPSSDLLTKGFSILPITIRNMNISMLGGSVSDVGDFYIFNGDYFPGDEFSYNNRTYVIFPVGLGYTTRLGLAIPKE